MSPLEPNVVYAPSSDWSQAEIERLRADNARLREALREYVATVVEAEGVTFVDQMLTAELRDMVESVFEKEEK